MEKSIQTSKTHLASTARSAEKSGRPGEDTSPQWSFLSSALSMSWQLATIVLLPVLGGFALDGQLDSSPLWTVVGFVIALGGTFGLFRRLLASPDTDKATQKDAK